MAKKRQTNAEKHGVAWYRKLPPRLKVAEDILNCECDEIGVWPIDMEKLSWSIGEEVTLEELKRHFGVEVLNEEELWIPGFVELQVGEKETGRLSPDAPYHRDLAEKLMRRGLPVPEFNHLKKKSTPAAVEFLEAMAFYKPHPAFIPFPGPSHIHTPSHPVSQGGTTPPPTRDGGGVQPGYPVKEEEKANGEVKENSELCGSSENYVFPTETSAENPPLSAEDSHSDPNDFMRHGLEIIGRRARRMIDPATEVFQLGGPIPCELEKASPVHPALQNAPESVLPREVEAQLKAALANTSGPIALSPEVLPPAKASQKPTRASKRASKHLPEPPKFNPVWIWCELYRQAYGFSPEIGKEEAGKLTNFGKSRSEAKVRTFFACYFAMKDPFYVKTKHPVGIFFRDMALVNAGVKTGKDPTKTDYEELLKGDANDSNGIRPAD